MSVFIVTDLETALVKCRQNVAKHHMNVSVGGIFLSRWVYFLQKSYNLFKKGTGKDSWSVGEKQTLMKLATSLPDCCTKAVFPVFYSDVP